MSFSRGFVWLCAAALGLAGCAAKPEIPFDRATAGNIKSIGVITPAVPSEGSVVLASTIGQSFGLIGGLVDATLQASRDSHFKEILQKQGVVPADIANKSLESGLAAHGFTASPVDIKRDHATDFLSHYPKPGEANVDAYFDVVVEDYGYLAAGISSSNPFRPYFKAKAKLIRASDGAVLMQDAVIYNPLNEEKGVITIAPEDKYQYKDFDTLEADPADAAEGLRRAIEQSVSALTNLLG